MKKVHVTVYSTQNCPWCHKAKDYLTKKKVKFEDINITENEQARNAMIEKSGQMGVPVIEVTKEGAAPVIIVGFDEEALEEALE
ncbi:MAG TPA: glutaredoxin domain-containing protein [Candidatus Nanoarchaeia archaeon]|nr:glutaredoxin domain-containing protein [Candidatus Nanoarchaeia archaeon]